MKKLADFKTALALHVFPSYVNTWSSERRKAFERVITEICRNRAFGDYVDRKQEC